MTVYQKMARVAKGLDGKLKKSGSSGLGYKFHGIAGLLDALRPFFIEEELLMFANFTPSEHMEPGRIAGKVELTILDAESAAPVPIRLVAECYVDNSNSGRSDGKGAGMAMSYGIKNILKAILMIGEGEDDPEALDKPKKETDAALKVLRATAKEKFGKTAGATLNRRMKATLKKTDSKSLSFDEIKELTKWVEERETPPAPEKEVKD